MDSEQMFLWSEELSEINKNLKLLTIEADQSPIIIEPLPVVHNVNRNMHLNRIKNLSPWQKALVDPELLKESESI